MLRLLLLSCLALCAVVQTATAQSATQTITIVVEPHQSLSSGAGSITLEGASGERRLTGEMDYALKLSAQGKITAAISHAPGVSVSAVSSSTNGLSMPSELSSDTHTALGELVPTFGQDLHIAYTASIESATRESAPRRGVATVTLTLTN